MDAICMQDAESAGSDFQSLHICWAGVPPPYNIGVERMWYRRWFQLPGAPANASNFLLHFDGVDWEAEVWLDGVNLGDPHRGG